jgi:hypothetical protein
MARAGGPVPNRSDQRRRRNKVDIDRAPTTTDRVFGPEPPEWLNGLALDWFQSLRTSGQAVYYTDSDWSSALIVAKAVERFEERPSAHMLTAILSGIGSLAATEGERRRLRIELERTSVQDADEDAAVTALNEWRDRISG